MQKTQKNIQKILKDRKKLVSWLLLEAKDESDMYDILEDILTPAEIVEIGERIMLMQELKTWKSQRQVAEDLWMSVTTVNRGARILTYGTWIMDKLL